MPADHRGNVLSLNPRPCEPRPNSSCYHALLHHNRCKMPTHLLVGTDDLRQIHLLCISAQIYLPRASVGITSRNVVANLKRLWCTAEGYLKFSFRHEHHVLFSDLVDHRHAFPLVIHEASLTQHIKLNTCIIDFRAWHLVVLGKCFRRMHVELMVCRVMPDNHACLVIYNFSGHNFAINDSEYGFTWMCASCHQSAHFLHQLPLLFEDREKMLTHLLLRNSSTSNPSMDEYGTTRKEAASRLS
mmetsp:Transcript_119959/g.224265  ORF Transcript_119959/g.224265 Transcript_119959/m.224265 type:complete len:243 (-) Transcript_119959:69-797(-)